MFQRLDARSQISRAFIILDGKATLQNEWARVEFFGYKMHGTAMPFVASIQYPLMGIQARIGRQQSRMNIQDAAAEVVDEPRAKNAHETGEDEQVCAGVFASGSDGAVE